MFKKRVLSVIFAVVLTMGMIPAVAHAADPIVTDLVIHKMVVASGTSLAPHDGKEITDFTGTNLDGATPLGGVEFKYWEISPSATPAQLSAIQGLTTIEAIEAYATANSTVLTNGTSTSATDATGAVSVTGLAEGKYIFGEVNGAANNVTEYLGVPFLLELPAMKADGTGYFGTGTNALHIYPKNVLNHPGLDVKTVNEAGTQIGGAIFTVQMDNGSGTYETLTGSAGTISLPSGFLTLADLPAGSYQLVNTTAPGGYVVDNRPVKFTVSAGQVTFDSPNSPRATFTPAAITGGNPLITIMFLAMPDIDKTENVGGTAQVGETVLWTISVSVPTDIANYTKFNLVDVIDSRLDYDTSQTVAVSVDGGSALVAGTHYVATYTSATSTLLIEFNQTTLSSYEGERILVTFSTTINETALMGSEVPNNATVDYDNSYGSILTPNDPTPPSVWTGGAQFSKVDGANSAVVLAGAEFKIATDAAGTTFLTWTQALIDANTVTLFVTPVVGADITMKSGANGLFEIKGLKGGTYYLVETKAPNVGGIQYNLLRDPAAFSITKTSYESVNTMQVLNNTGLEIPFTGGVGTVVFTVIGVALMVLAITLFRKRDKRVQ